MGSSLPFPAPKALAASHVVGAGAMPDQWELDHHLNPDDHADCNGDQDKDGYTNLEEYLDSLVEPH